MEITDELLDKLATLARLDIPVGERSRIREDFRRMLDFVDQLRGIDTAGVEPLIHPTGEVHRLRTDEPATPLPPDAVLYNAPDSEGLYFRVPKVVDKRS
ncbi:MAG: Asp-tRNA(Asn)/Glu-tRNA(Gln) amidotransferase subunit GatC [Bacteroidia bacterium]